MVNESIRDYDPFYYDRANTLGNLIRHMDDTCGSFKGESDGIRVALVTEYLKNGLCRYIQDAVLLLECQMEPDMIVQIVDEAIEFARGQISPKDSDMEAEKSALIEEFRKERIEDIEEKLRRAKYPPCLDDQKMEPTDPGREAK